MLPLVKAASDVLDDPAAAIAERNIATATILAALEHGVEVPGGARMAIWRHLLASDGSAVVLHRNELIDPDVACDALAVLRDPDSGEASADLALAALKGDNVRAITDDDLITLAARLTGEGNVRRLTWLVQRVHEERGLSPGFLAGLRDRLAGVDEPAVRVGAVEIAALAARLDESFAIRMGSDPAPSVRVAVAELLERTDALDRPLALVLVRRRLEVEQHRSALSALHHAMGALVSGGRRVRAWEPPTGSQN